MKSNGKTNFNRRDFLKTLSLGATAITIPRCVRAASSFNSGIPTHPNIVFIMANDMGYGDVGCYNVDSKIPTPNIDKLAKQGIHFIGARSGINIHKSWSA
jgi:hypothetical protein